MFAGLVATASSRSSSPTSTSPVSPHEDDFSAGGGAASADRHAPSFASPLLTMSRGTPSPWSGGRRDMARGAAASTAGAPSSTEFLSPFSVGGYPTPSTGGRRGRYEYAGGVDKLSPLHLHSWGTSPSHVEAVEDTLEGEERVDEGDAYYAHHGEDERRNNNTNSSRSSVSTHSGPMQKNSSYKFAADQRSSSESEDVVDEGRSSDGDREPSRFDGIGAEDDEEGTLAARLERHRVSLSPLSSPTSNHSFRVEADEDTNLEKLARQQSTPSSSQSPPLSVTARQEDVDAPALGDDVNEREVLAAQLQRASSELHSSPRQGLTSTPQRVSVFSSSQPVTASALVSRLHRQVDTLTDALSPITPPSTAPSAAATDAAAASQRVPAGNTLKSSSMKEGSGAMTKEVDPRRHQPSSSLLHASFASSFSQASTSSSSASTASTPYAPPLDSPPDSAMKRPPGAVVVMSAAAEEEKEDGERKSTDRWASTTSVNDASTGRAVTAVFNTTADDDRGEAQKDERGKAVERVAVHHDDTMPLLYGVQYMEEEHRVQLELQETEERRCLFRAHRAVRTLYRMWAADDAQEDSLALLEEGGSSVGSGPALITDRPHAQMGRLPASLGTVAGESFNSSVTSTAERVQQFLSTSIESARERRSGSARAAAAAETSAVTASAPHRVAPAAITDRRADGPHEEAGEKGKEHVPPIAQLPLSAASSFSAPAASHVPPPSGSAAAVPLSPPASRHLDYSSLLQADPRHPVNTSSSSVLHDSSVLSARQPRRPWELKPHHAPQQPQHDRLFSPWRSDPSARRASPFAQTTPSAKVDLTGSKGTWRDLLNGAGKAHDTQPIMRGGTESEMFNNDNSSNMSSNRISSTIDGVRRFSPLIPRIRRTSPPSRGTGPAASPFTSPSTVTPLAAARQAAASSSFVSEYMASINARRRADESERIDDEQQPQQQPAHPHAYSSVAAPAAGLPTSSALAAAFSSLARQRADAVAEGSRRLAGDTRDVLSTSPAWRDAAFSPALVRSPRVGLHDAAKPPPPSPPRWNKSPNLRSTAAASRRVSSTENFRGRSTAAAFSGGAEPRGTTTNATQAFETRSAPATAEMKSDVDGAGLGYVPNNAFWQRQRAASLNSPSKSPLDDDAFLPPTRASVKHALSEENRRRERLSSYVQYKRFFDTTYGTTRQSPVRAAEAERQSPYRASFSFGTQPSAAPNARTLANVYVETRTPSAVPPRTWSPDIFPRRAVPHPSTQPSRAGALPSSSHSYYTGSSNINTTSRISSTSRGSARTDEDNLALHADVYTARLTRLCTLEQLCRAELQRRWMEDQNGLLHRFVMDGTATLQRVRVTREALGEQGGRRSQSRQQQQRRRRSAVDNVADARAWTFIPNEME